MRNLSGHVPLILGLVLVCTLAPGCRSNSPGAPASGASLRIGAVENSPPLIFRQKGRWDGVEADLGRALAARLGMKPVFVAYPPEKLASALLDGKVDLLMAGISITEERRVQMDFSSPYLVVGQVALIRTADILNFNTPIKIWSTRGRVGVVAGTAGDPLVSRYFTSAKRIPYPDAGAAIQALRKGQIDMLIHDAPAVWWLLPRDADTLTLAPALFAREEIAWAFRRGSVTLRESANQALADWQKDGTLASTLQRWVPFSQ